MDAYFNEGSTSTAQKGDALALVQTLIEVSKSLKTEYGVDIIKIPKDFKSVIIANDRSLAQLIQIGSGLPMNQVMGIIGFLEIQLLSFKEKLIMQLKKS